MFHQETLLQLVSPVPAKLKALILKHLRWKPRVVKRKLSKLTENETEDAESWAIYFSCAVLSRVLIFQSVVHDPRLDWPNHQS